MLRLRPYKKCDAQHIVCWIKDEISFRQWCADRYDHYPITADDMNAHYSAFEMTDTFFPFTAFDDSGVAGHLIMRFTDEAKTTLRFGFVIVDDSKRGKGYGKEMLTLAIRYGFDIMKAERITLGVFENNLSAYHCYIASGFRDITPHDAETYQILGECWKCLELEITE